VKFHATRQDDETTEVGLTILICPRKPPGHAESVCHVAVHVFDEVEVEVEVEVLVVLVTVPNGFVATCGIAGDVNGDVSSLTTG
jgi:hypothetical protein